MSIVIRIMICSHNEQVKRYFAIPEIKARHRLNVRAYYAVPEVRSLRNEGVIILFSPHPKNWAIMLNKNL